LRDHYQEFKAKGAEVVVVGMGFPAMAVDFREQFKIPFPILIDSKRTTYQALNLKRGALRDYIGVHLWAGYFKGSLLKGLGGGMAKKGQDPAQLGGAIVVGKGGKLKLAQRAKDAADNIPAEKLLAALD
jgi:hypothetical protein